MDLVSKWVQEQTELKFLSWNSFCVAQARHLYGILKQALIIGVLACIFVLRFFVVVLFFEN